MSHYADELEGIAEAIREVAPDLTVEVEDPKLIPPGKYGVIYAEVLNVTLPVLGGYVFGKIADAVISKAQAGWDRKQKHNARPRPRYVNILGPDGEVLRKVRIPPEE